MDSTKQQICQTAKNLFNERGYRSVTMRSIAGAASISLGTLTYHYAHKQDLLVAIMDSTIRSFPSAPPKDVEGLHQLLFRLMESIAESPFYFNDPSIYSSVPQLQARHQSSVGKLSELLSQTLTLMVSEGLFSSELTPERIESMVLLLLSSHTGWAQHNCTWTPETAISIETMLRTQWTALCPYLTSRGRQEYKALHLQY